MSESLYTIGQTARICNISVQSLRFYDKIGLIKPAATEECNGYRFYSDIEILRIKIVQDLRRMQFSLEEIADVLKSDGLEDVLDAMNRKRSVAFQELHSLENRLSLMEKRIQDLNNQLSLRRAVENINGYVEVKWVQDRMVVFDRRRSACGMGPYIMRFTELFNRLQDQGFVASGYFMAIYHENILQFDRADSDIELCLPIDENITNSLNTRIIPAGQYLTSTYSGVSDENTCRRTYTELISWMHSNGYEECGPVIEQYMIDLTNMVNPNDLLIELQIPVRKVLGAVP